MFKELDIDHLKSWIGKTEIVEDILTPSLEQKFRATLDIDVGNPKLGDESSSGIHWTLAPPITKFSELGKDSHAARGGFLPPVPLPRRMWAGCETYFLSPFYVGDNITRKSSVVDVLLKDGKTGKLCFVKIKHEFIVKNKKVLNEFQDIVYRDMGQNISSYKVPLPFEKGEIEEEIFTHPTLLFRYSAITFNGHRIHYDYKYSKEEENYKDLVFHGPLQATLLLRASEKLANKKAKKFIHKGTAPVFANENLKIKATCSNENEITSFASTDESGMTMKGSAEF